MSTPAPSPAQHIVFCPDCAYMVNALPPVEDVEFAPQDRVLHWICPRCARSVYRPYDERLLP